MDRPPKPNSLNFTGIRFAISSTNNNFSDTLNNSMANDCGIHHRRLCANKSLEEMFNHYIQSPCDESTLNFENLGNVDLTPFLRSTALFSDVVDVQGAQAPSVVLVHESSDLKPSAVFSDESSLLDVKPSPVFPATLRRENNKIANGLIAADSSLRFENAQPPVDRLPKQDLDVESSGVSVDVVADNRTSSSQKSVAVVRPIGFAALSADCDDSQTNPHQRLPCVLVGHFKSAEHNEAVSTDPWPSVAQTSPPKRASPSNIGQAPQKCVRLNLPANYRFMHPSRPINDIQSLKGIVSAPPSHILAESSNKSANCSFDDGVSAARQSNSHPTSVNQSIHTVARKSPIVSGVSISYFSSYSNAPPVTLSLSTTRALAAADNSSRDPHARIGVVDQSRFNAFAFKENGASHAAVAPPLCFPFANGQRNECDELERNLNEARRRLATKVRDFDSERDRASRVGRSPLESGAQSRATDGDLRDVASCENVATLRDRILLPKRFLRRRYMRHLHGFRLDAKVDDSRIILDDVVASPTSASLGSGGGDDVSSGGDDVSGDDVSGGNSAGADAVSVAYNCEVSDQGSQESSSSLRIDTQNKKSRLFINDGLTPTLKTVTDAAAEECRVRDPYLLSYKLMRQRNNQAVRRCRAKMRARQLALHDKMLRIASDNELLRKQLADLTSRAITAEKERDYFMHLLKSTIQQPAVSQ